MQSDSADENGGDGDGVSFIPAVVVGYLDVHESDFEDASGKPAALWRVVYDNEEGTVPAALPVPSSSSSSSSAGSPLKESLAGDVEDLEESDIIASLPKKKKRKTSFLVAKEKKRKKLAHTSCIP